MPDAPVVEQLKLASDNFRSDEDYGHAQLLSEAAAELAALKGELAEARAEVERLRLERDNLALATKEAGKTIDRLHTLIPQEANNGGG